jgi:hypothetical protein
MSVTIEMEYWRKKLEALRREQEQSRKKGEDEMQVLCLGLKGMESDDPERRRWKNRSLIQGGDMDVQKE